MKNILILSNNAASNTESNGRIHMTHFQQCLEKDKIFNFYIRGNTDIGKVNYITVPNKKAVKSKLLFGLKKVEFNSINSISNKSAEAISSKANKPFYHFARNAVFSRNIGIIKALKNYVKNNKIDQIVLWGCNVSFLYEYSYKISKKFLIPLLIITCEDYPLKTYNYISKKRSLFFKFYQHSLKRWCLKAYKQSKNNIFTNEDLMKLYEEKTKCKNSSVVYFGSEFEKNFIKNVSTKVKILYGGNLYLDRVDSIVDIAEYLKNKNYVELEIYGKLSDCCERVFDKFCNLSYRGLVPYDELINKMNEADILLHVEGFSNEYINDCRYAFSTKISDYILSGKKLIIYGPSDISGIKFCKTYLPDYTICSKEELVKLDKIIDSKNQIDASICELFTTKNVSKTIYNIIHL